MSLLLKNGTVVSYPEAIQKNVWLNGDRLSMTPIDLDDTVEFDCKDCLIYPGFINLHEHLRINVMGKFGNPPYQTSSKWVEEHQSCEKYLKMKDFQDQLSVHYWGGLKNLFSGCTTVLDFGPPYINFTQEQLSEFPLHVHNDRNLLLFVWTDYSKKIIEESKKNSTVLTIHLGEGSLESSRLELDDLDKAGGLWDRTLLVHGIAFNKDDLSRIYSANARLVWCPSSNVFLIGKTLELDKIMKMDFPLILGSDSNNTGSKNLFEEIKYSRMLAKKDFNIDLSGMDVLKMITVNPAEFLWEEKIHGKIKEGYCADLFIYERDTEIEPSEQIFDLDFSGMKAIFSGGELVFVQKEFLPEEMNIDNKLYNEFDHNGKKYLLKGRDYNELKNYLEKNLGYEPADII